MKEQRYRPVEWWESCRIERMQVTVDRGHFIQLCANVGTRIDERFIIVEMRVDDDGNVELRGDIPILPWGSEAVTEAEKEGEDA